MSQCLRVQSQEDCATIAQEEVSGVTSAPKGGVGGSEFLSVGGGKLGAGETQLIWVCPLPRPSTSQPLSPWPPQCYALITQYETWSWLLEATGHVGGSWSYKGSGWENLESHYL